MKVSEITDQNVADYLRIDESDEDTLRMIREELIPAAIAYVKSYTGLEELDEYEDICPVIKVLCQDMYDNRSLYVEKANLNHMVSSILDLHSVNLV